MQNLIRTLVFDGQVSLTLADTTAIVKKGIQLHNLSRDAALVFGKTLSAMTFMSACLKEEAGEISLSVKTEGTGEEIGVSGNRRLHMRGFIANPNAIGTERTVLGEFGSLTIIRDDGYNRPFVGACAFPKTGGVDEAFEEYYRISEQLPTYLATAVEFDEKDEISFAGVAVLQPLPFADEAVLQKTRETSLKNLLESVNTRGVAESVTAFFTPDLSVWEMREAKYQCNCSRNYLTRVLVSLGEEQMRQIIKEDGAVRVHCHYCNTDYQFTEEDADELFAQGNEKNEERKRS